MTVWDGGGQDTYDFSNYSTGVTVNLAPGSWTTTSATQLANLGGVMWRPATSPIRSSTTTTPLR